MRLTNCLWNAKKVGEMTKKYANLPESYIDRSMEQVVWKTPRNNPRYLPRTVKKKKFYFGQERPWTYAFANQNSIGEVKSKVFVEPIKNWSFFKGDRVEILVGPDKGKQGIVGQIIQERNWVIVDGLNCELEEVSHYQGHLSMVQQKEKPLLVTSEVALVDPSDLQGCSVEWRFTENGERVRVSTRTGKIIPIPSMSIETYDYKTPKTYKESEKDTTEDLLTKITFEPLLKTFEMEIMDNMGIKEDRIPAPTFWY
ncbi:probable 39S ribosomal protein L24, mitochondrial [Daktulosphaira vitifoliae]|uniref:probable 39S ribosomal protein L24, mitochondrial n=1 Tax=Daktulosphaira vitifoliae TaxID=58002 RepID=UPI0021AACB5B|nr:probable 39S ribosomal protein L24, mitochondrial [Daktulosphaira vitifoliae]